MVSQLRIYISIIILVFVSSCNNDSGNKTSQKESAAVKKVTETSSVFESLAPAKTKVTFRNNITETMDFNFVTFLNMYNGGGVSIGDINNDGLEDLFFTGNQVSNKLYLNKGNLNFQDITNSAGVSDATGWTTGTTMVDINNDGLLDIYVCKAGPYKDSKFRKNRLFINQGNNTFKDEANAYGLADQAYSSQSYFFDYDKDGDLDLYLVNHRNDFVYTTVFDPKHDKAYDDMSSDKLYRNDNGQFKDISTSAGIRNKAWGHSAAIYDFNDDGKDDIYVCNDFLQGDNLWVNKGSGKFSDKIYTHIDHISQFSMGSDVADINNDGLMDLMVLDMVPEDHITSKMNMGTMDPLQFKVLREHGHHYQYMSNMLQLNRGQGSYSEIGNFAGVSKTDWSWAPLIADFDNDGIKDIFITNGIKRDLTSNDGKSKLNERAKQGAMTVDDAKQLIPSRKISNYLYTHKGDNSFKNVATPWGLGQKINSNGAAYGDLDNDGDLDLVINNLDELASIYENKSSKNYISINLKGSDKNKQALGTKLKLTTDSGIQTIEKRVTRGFMSSVSNKIIFGLGDNTSAQRLEILWPDGNHQVINNPQTNTTLDIEYSKNLGPGKTASNGTEIFKPENQGLSFTHKENTYDDFSSEILLPHKMSTLGPCIAKGDVNGDKKEDLFIGGASGQAGQLFLASANGYKKSGNFFAADKLHEDLGALFFDADGDGDNDLYVASGGNELGEPEAYADRLYINDNGNFKKDVDRLPTEHISSKALAASDFDNDGDLDLFVGGRIVPKKYPTPASSKILQNNNGVFEDVSARLIPQLDNLGLVTDALFSDYDNDGDEDLLVTGEWMGLVVFENNGGSFSQKNLDQETGIGWWYSITEGDIDKDGDKDYILGNLGLNNKFGATKKKPFHVFCSDFDNSGSLDIVLSKQSKDGKLLPVRGRECSSEQMPFIASKFPTFSSFAQADLSGILGQDKLDQAIHYEANNFASIILINEGNGSFRSKNLPMLAQIGPLLSSHIMDLNKDGHPDIIGSGSIFNSEAETVRYDASKGFVLLGDGKGNFEEKFDSGLFIKGNAKDSEIITDKGSPVLIVACNNGPVETFKAK